jgi:hypothetical protein
MYTVAQQLTCPITTLMIRKWGEDSGADQARRLLDVLTVASVSFCTSVADGASDPSQTLRLRFSSPVCVGPYFPSDSTDDRRKTSHTKQVAAPLFGSNCGRARSYIQQRSPTIRTSRTNKLTILNPADH